MKAAVSENLRLALGTLRAHKLRSALTIVGVVIGTTCVIAIGSILTGMDRRIIAELQQFGTNTIFVQKFSIVISFGNSSREERMRKPISYQDYEMVRDSCSACRHVSLDLDVRMIDNARYGKDRIENVKFSGTLPNFPDAMNFTVKEGRQFTWTDNLHRSPVCIIGSEIAKTFFRIGGAAVGKEITINGYTCEVVGVLADFKGTVSGETSRNDSRIFTPYEMFRKLYPHAEEHFMPIQAFEGRLNEAIDQVRDALRRSRRVRYNEPDNFGMATSDSVIEQFHQITGAIALVMVVISSIGLLVGGVGVMNIMLVSVTERTREIGVRKAIGARRRDIVLQFLLEACALTGAGGVMGILLGLLISLLIQVTLPALPSVVPLWAIAVGFLVSVSVGLFFGMWPAVKASRLDPVEALRYE